MRKILLLILIFSSQAAFAQVNQDLEVHKVIGGLYSLAAASNLNLQSNANVKKINNNLWVGIDVDKYSTARRFLRNEAKNLDLREAPDGYYWLGGDEVWLNASKLNLLAAKGSGQDNELLFLSSDNGETWWLSSEISKQTQNQILKKFAAKNPPELHKPSGQKQSLYESVKPADVVKPDDMRMSRKKSSFDMEFEVGKDVIFNPIPNRRN